MANSRGGSNSNSNGSKSKGKKGACCFNGKCLKLTEDSCDNKGGVFFGEKSKCKDVICNDCPVVHLGGDITVCFVDDFINLAPFISDDGFPIPPGALTYSWSSSDETIATVDSPSSPSSDITFVDDGIVEITLCVFDGECETCDTIEINIVPPTEIKLTASDASVGEFYGLSVAIDGDIAVTGARGGGNFTGSSYVYERILGVWTEVKKLTASDGASNDTFGTSVAISGTTIIIGAPGDDGTGFDEGSAYIFEKGVTWPATETKKIVASDAAVFDNFGFSVGISGTIAIIGARTDDGVGSNEGSAYIFEKGVTWPSTETVKLVASDAFPGGQFGFSVGISGTIAIVGTPFDDDGGTQSGSAYIFECFI